MRLVTITARAIVNDKCDCNSLLNAVVNVYAEQKGVVAWDITPPTVEETDLPSVTKSSSEAERDVFRLGVERIFGGPTPDITNTPTSRKR